MFALKSSGMNQSTLEGYWGVSLGIFLALLILNLYFDFAMLMSFCERVVRRSGSVVRCGDNRMIMFHVCLASSKTLPTSYPVKVGLWYIVVCLHSQRGPGG